MTNNQRSGKSLKARLAWFWRAPVWAVAIVMILTLVATTVYGATRFNAQTTQTSTLPTSSLWQPVPAESRTAPTDQPAIQLAVNSIEADGDLVVGVAIGQIASAATSKQYPWVAGTLRSGDAGSTVDVPMALAVMEEPKQPEDLDYLLDRGLVDDSQAGDDALWAFLGSGSSAAEKITNVLRRYGDWRTIVEANDEDQNYQLTQWRLDSQVDFFAATGCDYLTTSPVMIRLRNRGTDFGLNVAPNAYVETSTSEKIDETTETQEATIRQAGIIDLVDGTQVAVSLIITSSSGDLQSAADAATSLARTIVEEASGFPTQPCFVQ